jgi:hypothetical protein
MTLLESLARAAADARGYPHHGGMIDAAVAQLRVLREAFAHVPAVVERIDAELGKARP